MARLNAANADVQQDQGEVDRLAALEDFKKLVAPFDGIVTARETDIGALINAGSGTGPELFKVADIHKMRIYVQVPQQLSAGIRPRLTADLTLPQYPDKTFKSTIATTSSAINMSARTLLVELHADNPDGLLQPGAYAQVTFQLPTDPNVVRIPTSALLFREQGLQVATLGPGDKIKLKSVKLGRNLGTDAEVVSGSRCPIGSSTVRRIRSRLATWCASPNSRLRQTSARLTRCRLNDLAIRHAYRIWPSSPSLPLPRPQGAARRLAPPTGRDTKRTPTALRALRGNAPRLRLLHNTNVGSNTR